MLEMYRGIPYSPVAELADDVPADTLSTEFIHLTSTAALPRRTNGTFAVPNLLLLHDDTRRETIRYTAVSGTSVTGLTRRLQDDPMVKHTWPEGTTVSRRITELELQNMKDNITTLDGNKLDSAGGTMIGPLRISGDRSALGQDNAGGLFFSQMRFRPQDATNNPVFGNESYNGKLGLGNDNSAYAGPGIFLEDKTTVMFQANPGEIVVLYGTGNAPLARMTDADNMTMASTRMWSPVLIHRAISQNRASSKVTYDDVLFENEWVNSYSNESYMTKTMDNVVFLHIRGYRTEFTEKNICTLPTKYRPSRDIRTVGLARGGGIPNFVGYPLIINSNGSVSFFGTAMGGGHVVPTGAAFISLDISFPL